jgi:hypothetical protein
MLRRRLINLVEWGKGYNTDMMKAIMMEWMEGLI